MKSCRALARFSTTCLTVVVTAALLSSCGLFHAKKKPVKKPRRAEHSSTVARTQTPPPLPPPLPQNQDTNRIADKIPPLPTTDVEKTESLVEKPYPTAEPIPGKPGQVYSPYNHRAVDVDGLGSGKLVRDPTYPAAEKKFFYTP